MGGELKKKKRAGTGKVNNTRNTVFYPSPFCSVLHNMKGRRHQGRSAEQIGHQRSMKWHNKRKARAMTTAKDDVACMDRRYNTKAIGLTGGAHRGPRSCKVGQDDCLSE